MNNSYSCAHVAVLSCAYEFFRRKCVEERMMHVADSVFSMDKAKIKKRFFPIFGGNYQKLLYKKLQHSYREMFYEKRKDDYSQESMRMHA